VIYVSFTLPDFRRTPEAIRERVDKYISGRYLIKFGKTPRIKYKQKTYNGIELVKDSFNEGIQKKKLITLQITKTIMDYYIVLTIGRVCIILRESR
jgi:hypothetical protein